MLYDDRRAKVEPRREVQGRRADRRPDDRRRRQGPGRRHRRGQGPRQREPRAGRHRPRGRPRRASACAPDRVARSAVRGWPVGSRRPRRRRSTSTTATRWGSAASPARATPRPCRRPWPAGSRRPTPAARSSGSGSGPGPRPRPRSTGCSPRPTASTSGCPTTPTRPCARQINAGEVDYVDTHLSHSAQHMWFGFYGPLDVAVVEVAAILPERAARAGQLGRQQQDLAGPRRPGDPRGQPLAAPRPRGLPRHLLRHPAAAAAGADPAHPLDAAHRRPLPAGGPGEGRRRGGDRQPRPQHRRSSAPDEASTAMADLLVDFLRHEVSIGRMPPDLLPLQSGVGNVANAVMAGLLDSEFENMTAFTEVIQDGLLDLLDSGKLASVSATSFGLSPVGVRRFLDNVGSYKGRILLRSEEISNHPELVRRLGVIAINGMIEADIYGNVNSTHVMGSQHHERHRRQRGLRPQRLPQLLRVAVHRQGREDLRRSCRWSATSTTPSTTSTSSSPSRGWPTCAALADRPRRTWSSPTARTRASATSSPTTSSAPRRPAARPAHAAPARRGPELAHAATSRRGRCDAVPSAGRPAGVDAVIFDWGGTLTRWHDIDFHAESLALAQAVVDADHDRPRSVHAPGCTRPASTIWGRSPRPPAERDGRRPVRRGRARARPGPARRRTTSSGSRTP